MTEENQDKLIKNLVESSASSVKSVEENDFDSFEEHCCKGGLTETWLVPGGKEFWLIFKGEPERFTWIEFCPYCGYRPPNLRWDWNNREKHQSEFKIDGTSPVKDSYFMIKTEDHAT